MVIIVKYPRYCNLKKNITKIKKWESSKSSSLKKKKTLHFKHKFPINILDIRKNIRKRIFFFFEFYQRRTCVHTGSPLLKNMHFSKNNTWQGVRLLEFVTPDCQNNSDRSYKSCTQWHDAVCLHPCAEFSPWDTLP